MKQRWKLPVWEFESQAERISVLSYINAPKPKLSFNKTLSYNPASGAENADYIHHLQLLYYFAPFQSP